MSWRFAALLLVLVLGAAAALATLLTRVRERREARRVAAWKGCGGGGWLAGKAVLCLVNPVAGGGAAERVLEHVVRPMAAASRVELRVRRTEGPGHARSLAAAAARASRGAEPGAPDAVVCLGGDGLVHEALNGLADAGALDFPLGVVPVGSSNGTATSLLGRTPYEACVALLQAPEPRRVDAVRVRSIDSRGQEVGVPVHDTHVQSWGIIADHDRLVETDLRRLGPWLKNLYAPLHAIAFRKVYRGEILVRPAPCGARLAALGYHDAALLPEPPAGARPAPPGDWRALTGTFILVSASNLRWAAHDVQFAPAAVPADGAVDLLVIRGGASRAQLLQTFLALEAGTHLGAPWVEMYKVSAFMLRPAAPGGWLDLSGQTSAASDCVATVVPGAARFIF